MRNLNSSHLLGFRFGFAEKHGATCGSAKTKTIKPKPLYVYVRDSYNVHTRTHPYVRARVRVRARMENFSRGPGFWFGSFPGAVR